MFNQTQYQVIISPDGHQTIRSTASNSSLIIDQDQRTGTVSVHRRT